MEKFYLLEYVVVMKDPSLVMNKKKLFKTYDEANNFQLQYNKNFDDRKIVHFEIHILEFMNLEKAKSRGDIDKL